MFQTKLKQVTTEYRKPREISCFVFGSEEYELTVQVTEGKKFPWIEARRFSEYFKQFLELSSSKLWAQKPKKNQRNLINPLKTFVVRITAIHFYGVPYASGYKN